MLISILYKGIKYIIPFILGSVSARRSDAAGPEWGGLRCSVRPLRTNLLGGASQFDEASNFRYQAFGYDDHSLAPQPECSFVFCERLILSLLLVMFQDALNPGFVPAGRKSISFHQRLPLSHLR